MAGTLYVVSTPIGNLDDLTIRAGKVLASVDAVLAEDTRRTRNLLTHLGLQKPLRRFDAHAEAGTVDRIAKEIVEGANLALVSDAGTPVISDPGAELVRAVVDAGGKVIAIPGASAVLTALVASGLAGGGFRFFGFLPRGGSERLEVLAKIVETSEPVVFYEAGNRTLETLRDLADRMPTRRAAVARELTKLHEEYARGTLRELTSMEEPRGEVTVVLGAAEERTETIDEAAIDTRIDRELASGRSAKDTADIVAAWTGQPRREIYARVTARKPRT
jgi:16S rRNA (cytidine1402-2'-O)-methyltransferase